MCEMPMGQLQRGVGKTSFMMENNSNPQRKVGTIHFMM